MSNQLTHTDVGLSRQVARVLGKQPTTKVLCGAKDGLTIRDSHTEIQRTGTYPAACDCGACQAIARIMYHSDCNVERARHLFRRQGQERWDNMAKEEYLSAVQGTD